MADNDLIRRGDAKAICGTIIRNDEAARIEGFLATLPAAQVTVKPLEWFEVEKYRYGGKYTSEGYTIRYIEGFFILDFAGNGKTVWRFPTLEAAKAAAQADYAARIRSALTVTTHDPAKVRALVEAAEMLEPYLDAIICYASTMDEHEPNRIAHDFRATLAAWKEG